MKRVLAVCVLFAFACSGETPKVSPEVSEPHQDANGLPTCSHDRDCTNGWHPTESTCAPPSRCFSGRCVTPPAITGTPLPGTGRLVLETAPSETEVQIEIADERFEITRGLMCRDHMVDGWGMLFIMEQARQQSFWMKNTLIPLDIIFIDAQWAVLGVSANATPQTLSGRSVPGISKYVLELKAGAAAAAGIQAGTRVRYFAPSAP